MKDPKWPGMTPSWDSLREEIEEPEERSKFRKNHKTDYLHTFEEIAKEMGETRAAVIHLCQRGSKKVREAFEKLFPGDTWLNLYQGMLLSDIDDTWKWSSGISKSINSLDFGE